MNSKALIPFLSLLLLSGQSCAPTSPSADNESLSRGGAPTVLEYQASPLSVQQGAMHFSVCKETTDAGSELYRVLSQCEDNSCAPTLSDLDGAGCICTIEYVDANGAQHTTVQPCVEGTPVPADKKVCSPEAVRDFLFTTYGQGQTVATVKSCPLRQYTQDDLAKIFHGTMNSTGCPFNQRPGTVNGVNLCLPICGPGTQPTANYHCVVSTNAGSTCSGDLSTCGTGTCPQGNREIVSCNKLLVCDSRTQVCPSSWTFDKIERGVISCKNAQGTSEVVCPCDGHTPSSRPQSSPVPAGCAQ